MIDVSMFAPTGAFIGVIQYTASDLMVLDQMETDTTLVVGMELNENYYYDHSEPSIQTAIKHKPTPPSPNHAFDYATKQWIDPRSLTEHQQAKLAELDIARQNAEVTPVTVQGYVFPATEAFQAKISRTLNYIGRGKPMNLNGAWRDATATPVNMTAALLGQIEDTIVSQGVVAWSNYWTKFDTVMAATTPEEVAAITW